MGTRRRSREAALKILYQCDITGVWDAHAAAEGYFSQFPETDVDERDFATSLASGVCASREAIDNELGRCLSNWTLERLGYMERSILRIGAFEILGQEFTPDKVAVDEAVRLAKQYCDKDSSRLVNGALQKVMERKYQDGGAGCPGGKMAV